MILNFSSLSLRYYIALSHLPLILLQLLKVLLCRLVYRIFRVEVDALSLEQLAADDRLVVTNLRQGHEGAFLTASRACFLSVVAQIADVFIRGRFAENR